jgi:type IX secretion system PorP/SprF family membrane protein
MKKFYSILFICFIGRMAFGQDQPDIAHYMIYHPLVNPAANGSYSEIAGIVYARKQWYSIDGSPASIGFQAVKPVKKLSLGISVRQESIGVHTKQEVFFTYTHRISFLKDQNIVFGLSPGLIFLTSNYGKIETTSGTDKEFTGSKSIIRPDFNFGVYYYTKNYYAGLSIPGLVKNSIVNSNGDLYGASSFAPEYWHYYLLGGYNFILNDYYCLNVSTLTKKVKGAPADIDFNVNLVYDDAIGAGISFRTQREVLLFANVKITNSIKLGYSYHIYFNSENQILSGHEIFITYNYLRSRQATIQSPRF